MHCALPKDLSYIVAEKIIRELHTDNSKRELHLSEKISVVNGPLDGACNLIITCNPLDMTGWPNRQNYALLVVAAV